MRVKPMVEVAIAVSACGTFTCRARRGARKRRPVPRPLIIWKEIMREREEIAVKVV